MHSLFYAVSSLHGDAFAPVKCNEQTVLRLIRYFEDVIIENRLSALVLEGRSLSSCAVSDENRLAQLAASSRHLYLFSVGESEEIYRPEHCPNMTFIEEKCDQAIETGPFILISDPRFSVLLASYALPQSSSGQKYYEVVWTLEPNAVFTAIEYFTARIASQKPDERASLEALLNASSPHSVSLRLALTITTKLTMLMQRQNELEVAINRISSAINSTLEIDSILQSVVEEVGRTLKARKTTLVLLQEGANISEDVKVFEQPNRVSTGPLSLNLVAGLSGNAYGLLNSIGNGTTVSHPPSDMTQNPVTPGRLEVAVTYRERCVGQLVIEDCTPGRVWEDEERLMALTVSDQLAIAISHARLFRHTQTLALTDPLTGLFNQRYFQDRVEREVKLADRKNTAVSLILLDLDGLKNINDTLGHTKGDAALTHVADILKSVLREIDICARFGGEEFVAILPDCGLDYAISVAERVREAVAISSVDQVGSVTISLGVATYPTVAKSTHELIEQADLAMCMAKAAGRNRVRTITNRQYSELKSSR